MPDGLTLGERLQEQLNLQQAAQWVREYAIQHAKPDGKFRVGEMHVRFLHLTIASSTSIKTPGEYRTLPLRKLNKHKPPEPSEVPWLMKEFVRHLNEIWEEQSVTEIAAFALWKLNWIHPFFNGNGRTSRLFSYLLMNMKAGHAPLPGKVGFLVPERLESQYRKEYEGGLEAADVGGDTSELRDLLSKLLYEQLLNV